MSWRYEVFVFPVDQHWCVALRDGEACEPEPMRNFRTATEAVDYAKGLAQTLTSTGEPARVHLREQQEERVIWALPSAQDPV